MTVDEVVEAGKWSYCQPEGRALLRYESSGDRPRPRASGPPSSWRAAAVYEQPVAESGWTHHPGCGCQHCHADVGSAATAQR